MADTAAHLVEWVLLEVPIRQWVLTLPYPLRYRCAWNATLTSEVLRAYIRSVFADQRLRARRLLGIRKGQCGSVTFIQRFGSALNLAPHFDTLVLDGVCPGPSHNPGDFVALPQAETDDVARVLAGTARRIKQGLEQIGVGDEDDPLSEDDPLMAALGAASIRLRIASGPEAGQPWRRLGDQVEMVAEEEAAVESRAAAPARCVRHGGMSLHADVVVPTRDRQRLERLCRYVARPPLALARLEAMSDGRLAYRLKTAWRDGTTHVVMERRELLERLAPLIPPPRAHQVRYHGVLAPCASARDRVVPDGPEGAREEPVASESSGSEPVSAESFDGAAHDEAPAAQMPPDLHVDRNDSPGRRIAWAGLLKRVFEVDALRCPACSGQMRLVAAIMDPSVAARILECLALPPRAPPLATAMEIELGSGFWNSALDSKLIPAHEDPGFEFAQTSAGDRLSNEDC